MKLSILLPAALAGSLLLHNSASAETVTTDPVGFATMPLLGNSDTHVSVPFTRPPEFVGGLQSVSGSPTNTITVSGTPWTANQFVYAPGTQPKNYYVLIGGGGSSNPKEGRTYFVTGNGTNTLTVSTAEGDLSGITANTQIVVIPYWTPATVFPPSDANVSFTPTTSTASYKTQIRIPNYSGSGINLPPSAVYYFSNNVDGSSSNVGWRQVGQPITADHGDDPLLPEGHFVMRNINGAPTLPMTALGSVLLKKLTVPLMTSASQEQDNPVSLLRPINVALNATGLNPADGSFVPNDKLLLFNNAAVGLDKAPSAIYEYAAVPNNSGGWRLTSDSFTDRGNDIVPSGNAMIVRKAALAGGATVFWTNSFPVTAISAVSRKSHGAAGVFDVPLPLSGTPGVECRSGGANNDYQIVFTFPENVTFSGADVTSGPGSVANTSGGGATQVTVNLTGVTNAQRLTVTLQGVNDGTNTNDVAVRLGVLVGDINGNGSVNATDIGQTKTQSGVPVTAANFRQDVVITGTINATDIGQVKARSGTLLPPP
jgi:uncharacterized protein (TIGR02597 family)